MQDIRCPSSRCHLMSPIIPVKEQFMKLERKKPMMRARMPRLVSSHSVKMTLVTLSNEILRLELSSLSVVARPDDREGRKRSFPPVPNHPRIVKHFPNNSHQPPNNFPSKIPVGQEHPALGSKQGKNDLKNKGDKATDS